MGDDHVEIYDTTLRDGSQGEHISFTVEDKVKIARRLDDFGVDYIEGGWPASNPKDTEFFHRMRDVPLRNARLAAFGSTRRAQVRPEDDSNLTAIVSSGASVATLFGKSWDFHVTDALRISLEENLQLIRDSVGFVASHMPETIFDAEHFFDGFRANPTYAIQCCAAAAEAGTDVVVLCDTNGGSLPDFVQSAVSAVRSALPGTRLGIHTHNDSGCAVANALVAVQAGCTHVQGTINGIGERCGNANLTSIIPALLLKMGMRCLPEGSLQHLTHLSNTIDEMANLLPDHKQPYVGRSAFAHKGGVHVDAVMKHASTYEHVAPEAVGNERRILVSELSGGATVAGKARMVELDLTKDSPATRWVLGQVAAMENEGYCFEGAEGSFELLLLKAIGMYRKLFAVKGFRVIDALDAHGEPVTEAVLKLDVNSHEEHCVAEGDGPVHALDTALRKALVRHYPEVEQIRLTDFRVRVVNVREGTAAKVRTIIESDDGRTSWSTVGVSSNIIQASWLALSDAVEYGLLREEKYRNSI